jgi:hypothetical protein
LEKIRNSEDVSGRIFPCDSRNSHGVGSEDVPVEEIALLWCTPEGGIIYMNQSESLSVPVMPFKVIQKGVRTFSWTVLRCPSDGLAVFNRAQTPEG